MIDRRILLTSGAGLASGMLLNPHQALADKQVSYEEAVRSTWAPLQIDGGPRELVRYATLAANSHNAQPWTFTISDGNIAIAPDFRRRCPAVDPDDHHLFVSLGCATENLILAASAAGLRAEPLLDVDGINVTLDRTAPELTVLFKAIPLRQSARSMYDGRLVGNESLRFLEQAGAGEGVSIMMLTDRAKIANVGDYVIQANSAQMSDKEFMNELIAWLRFNETPRRTIRLLLREHRSGGFVSKKRALS
jgi:hypothetical protein